jgi:HEAT repeat protein
MGASVRLLLLLSLVSAGVAATDSTVSDARQVLLEALNHEQKWAKVHAAEALLEAGDGAKVAAVFQIEANCFGGEPAYRVGIWRVLARALPQERSRWREYIARVFLDEAAPDRLFALESLAKLGDPLDPELLRGIATWATTATPAERIFADWIDWSRGESPALIHLQQALVSAEDVARLRAAFVLGEIGCRDPQMLATLAHAADREPLGVVSRPFVLGAAFRLQADPTALAAWRAALEVIRDGDDYAAAAAALPWLTGFASPQATRRLSALLQHPNNEVRIAAARSLLVSHAEAARKSIP